MEWNKDCPTLNRTTCVKKIAYLFSYTFEITEALVKRQKVKRYLQGSITNLLACEIPRHVSFEIWICKTNIDITQQHAKN